MRCCRLYRRAAAFCGCTGDTPCTCAPIGPKRTRAFAASAFRARRAARNAAKPGSAGPRDARSVCAVALFVPIRVVSGCGFAGAGPHQAYACATCDSAGRTGVCPPVVRHYLLRCRIQNMRHRRTISGLRGWGKYACARNGARSGSPAGTRAENPGARYLRARSHIQCTARKSGSTG